MLETKPCGRDQQKPSLVAQVKDLPGYLSTFETNFSNLMWNCLKKKKTIHKKGLKMELRGSDVYHVWNPASIPATKGKRQ